MKINFKRTAIRPKDIRHIYDLIVRVRHLNNTFSSTAKMAVWNLLTV